MIKILKLVNMHNGTTSVENNIPNAMKMCDHNIISISA